MKNKRMTIGWLVVAAALMIGMTACSNDDNVTEEPPTAAMAGVQVTVKAVMDDEAVALKFTAGDRLYVWRYVSYTGGFYYLNGILTMDGEPTDDGLGATFSGTLKAYDMYGREITDCDYTSLGSDPLTGSKATLIQTGAVEGCFDEANHSGVPFVEQYSLAADVNTLKKTALYVAGTYNSSGYTLTIQNPILNCNLGGLTAGATYSVTLGGTLFQHDYERGVMENQFDYTPTVTADGDGNVSFAISGYHEGLGYNQYWLLRLESNGYSYDYIIGQKQFAANVYDVTLSTPDKTNIVSLVGQVIGSDGKRYKYDELPSDVTAVAIVCYNDGPHGLALALTDEGELVWSTAVTTCATHTPAVPGGTWKLASKDEWDQMIRAAGGYAALRDGFSSVGGTNMQSTAYWSSTESAPNFVAYRYDFDTGNWIDGMKNQNVYVRACLEF